MIKIVKKALIFLALIILIIILFVFFMKDGKKKAEVVLLNNNSPETSVNNNTIKDDGAKEDNVKVISIENNNMVDKYKNSSSTSIRIHANNKDYIATMLDNPTANDLISQLPLTLSFHDYGGQEKISKLPHILTLQGAPTGDDPSINDIAYYAPDNVIVFYYRDINYWDGIIRLGEFNNDIKELRDMPDGFDVTIELNH